MVIEDVEDTREGCKQGYIMVAKTYFGLNSGQEEKQWLQLEEKKTHLISLQLLLLSFCEF